MSTDEQVRTPAAPTEEPTSGAARAPRGRDAGPGGRHDDGGPRRPAATAADAGPRQYAALVGHSAVQSLVVVGHALVSFLQGTRAYVGSLRRSSAPWTPRPAGSERWRPAAPAVSGTKAVREGVARVGGATRARWDGRTAKGATGTGRRSGAAAALFGRRPAAAVGGAGGATLAPPRPTPSLPRSADGDGFPTVDRHGRLVGRGRTVRRGIPALPLPDNPAAPRPKLAPEDGRPLVVKLGTLLIAAVAGVAAVVMTVGAIVPRAVADMVNSVDVEVILPQQAAFGYLEQPSRVYAADGTQLAELRAEVNRQVVPLDAIPLHMREAVIAAEDRSFFEHPGYSIEGIGRALFTNLRNEGVSEGGSTLTQQLAKMNFVGDEVTLERKISELFYAMKLEEEFTKDELLERYLNEIYFGSSAYGVQAAAQEYFGVDAEDLRIDQAALLAGVLPAPSAYNPRSNPDVAKDRRDQVLDDMVEIGALTPSQRDAAAARPIEVIDHVEEEVREPYVVAAVKRMFLDDPAFGATRQERENKLFRGDLDIFTTLDPELQEVAEETIDERYGDSSGPTAAIATVEPGTGAIVAFASGQEFDAEQFDYALQGRQQPGSAFKTFVLGAALKEGFSPNLVLSANSPIEVTYDNGRRTYEPSNYGGADYGQIDMATALRRSVNTYFVQLFEIVGREKAVTLAGELGIDVPAAIGTTADYGPSLTLGGLKAGVTPLEMAGAYATFANGGVFHRPYLIERVVDGNGTEMLERGADEGERVFSEDVNAVIVDIMRDVPAAGGTAPAAQISGWPEAGKTGTTNDNTDAWFVGYTPILSTAVWVGYPDADITMPGATGGGTAAPVWADFMRTVHAEREPVSFPDVSVDYSELFESGGRVPNVVGDEQTDALRALAENRILGTVVRVASGAPQGQVLSVRPGVGSTTSQATLVVSTGVPPPPPPPPEPEPEPEAPQSDTSDDQPDAGQDDSGDNDTEDSDTEDSDTEESDDSDGGDDDDDGDSGDDDSDDD